MAIWVKRTAETGDWVCVLGRGNVNERNYGLWLEANNRKYMFQQSGANFLNVYGKSLVPENQWIHLAVTIEKDLVRVYLNGVLDAEEKRPGSPPMTDAPLGISMACYHQSLVGQLDDARIYRRALTADEIKTLVDTGR